MEDTDTVPPGLKGMARFKTVQTGFDLNADLAKLGKAMGIDSANEVAVILGLQIQKGISMKTPVDTGRARANWFMAEGAPETSTTDAKTPKTYDRADFQGNGVPIFITNSLPYIVPLEYGHSKQAPAGMVRVTLAEIAAVSAALP